MGPGREDGRRRRDVLAVTSRREKLITYLDSVAGKPFEWGRHDCFTFANEAAKAQRGSGFLDDLIEEHRGYSTEFGALRRAIRVSRATKHGDIVSLIDERLARSPLRHPPIGSVIAMPVDVDRKNILYQYRLGVMGSLGAMCVGSHGILRMPIDGAVVWLVQ